jgi:hypothetical protein
VVDGRWEPRGALCLSVCLLGACMVMSVCLSVHSARWSTDVGSLVGLGSSGVESSSTASVLTSPFRLPPMYEDAKEKKVQALAELRTAVKAVSPVQWARGRGDAGELAALALSDQLPLQTRKPDACLVLLWQAVLDDQRKRELQNVIQAYFKEWLLSSGNMRQVYDLARMERETNSERQADG